MSKRKEGHLSITPIGGSGPIVYEDGCYGTRRIAMREDDDYDPSHDTDRKHLDAEDRPDLDEDDRVTRLR